MKKNTRITATLLRDFYNSLEQRSPIFLVDKALPSVLNWKIVTWKSRWTTSERKEKGEDLLELEMEGILDMIITKIGERTLEYKHWLFSTLFLEHFKNHVDNNVDEQTMVKNRKKYYIEALFRLFYKLVFEKVASSDESDYFWSIFPSEWKVTKNNLLDGKNVIARISCNTFMDWARSRIWSNQTFDKQLNDVSQNLFPEVHPETWAMILILVFSPFSPENRIKSIVERPWTFGFRIRSYEVSLEKNLERIIEEKKVQDEIEIKSTYELAMLIFKEIFTKEALEDYIKQTNKLEYSADSTENYKKKELLKLFNDLLAILNKKE